MPRSVATRPHTSVSEEYWQQLDRTRPLFDRTEPNELCTRATEYDLARTSYILGLLTQY
jgi:hypothetical protein